MRISRPGRSLGSTEAGQRPATRHDHHRDRRAGRAGSRAWIEHSRIPINAATRRATDIQHAEHRVPGVVAGAPQTLERVRHAPRSPDRDDECRTEHFVRQIGEELVALDHARRERRAARLTAIAHRRAEHPRAAPVRPCSGGLTIQPRGGDEREATATRRGRGGPSDPPAGATRRPRCRPSASAAHTSREASASAPLERARAAGTSRADVASPPPIHAQSRRARTPGSRGCRRRCQSQRERRRTPQRPHEVAPVSRGRAASPVDRTIAANASRRNAAPAGRQLVEQRHGQRCTDLRGHRRDDHEAYGGCALPADGRPRATDVAVHALEPYLAFSAGRCWTCAHVRNSTDGVPARGHARSSVMTFGHAPPRRRGKHQRRRAPRFPLGVMTSAPGRESEMRSARLAARACRS